MLKILKNLKQSWMSVLIIVALLCVQAAVDLELPNYTSKIVNTGIQAGGIEYAVPETVSPEDMDAILLFSNDDEKILENYTTDNSDGNYVIKDLKENEKEELEQIMTKPIIISRTVQKEEMANKIKEQILANVPDEQKEMLEQIKSSCKYMYDLIFTILDTYLYDNGLTKINAEKFDILALLNETTRSMSNLLRERNQKLIINTNLTSNIVIADKVQIKRVIINLLANAVKHGFKNSDIEVFVTENDENIKMEVKNKSEYINKEQMKEIFEKYKHSRNAKSIKTSTGLGLYLSKQIIDAHNGQVYAHSDENKNCTFGFEIPKKLVSNPTNKQEIH